MTRRLLIVCALALVATACDKKSPSGPSTSTSSVPTRIMRLEANLEFGNVIVGQSSERDLRIYNDGNSPLTVTSLTGPNGTGSVIVASWTSGTIAPGTSQLSVIRFTPNAIQSFSGNLTVNANQTSGSNTTPLSGAGVGVPRDPFSRTGSGNTVFDMPGDVVRLKIFGRWSGRGTSNFIVEINGRLVVNEILRERGTYEGIHLVPGAPTIAKAVVEISSSSEIVEWRFTEER